MTNPLFDTLFALQEGREDPFFHLPGGDVLTHGEFAGRAARMAGALVAQGRTLLLTTHYMEEAERLCDRIAIINHGEIIAFGTMDELRSQAEAGGAHLEEIFLKVTGGEAMNDVIESLREAIEQ